MSEDAIILKRDFWRDWRKPHVLSLSNVFNQIVTQRPYFYSLLMNFQVHIYTHIYLNLLSWNKWVLTEIFLLVVNGELLYNGFGFFCTQINKTAWKDRHHSSFFESWETQILKGKMTRSKSWKGSVKNHTFWHFIVDDESTIDGKM